MEGTVADSRLIRKYIVPFDGNTIAYVIDSSLKLPNTKAMALVWNNKYGTFTHIFADTESSLQASDKIFLLAAG